MASTERVVVLMSPAEKSALEAKAARSGRISTGEFVRRAVDAYDSETGTEVEELKALLAVFKRTHTETLREMDRVGRKIDRTLEELRAMDRRA